MAALPGVDPHVEGDAAARAEEDSGAFGGQARPVGGDQHVGTEQVPLPRAQLTQARRAHLLAHLDQILGVEAEPAADFEHGAKRADVDRVLALVVDHAAAVPAVTALRQTPRRETLTPAVLKASDDVAMAVA